MLEDGAGYPHEELPKLNIDLLERAVDWAERSEENKIDPAEPQWNQMHWAGRIRDYILKRPRDEQGRFSQGQVEKVHTCGTSYCLAGYGVQKTGNGEWVTSNQFAPKEEVVPYSGEPIDSERDWHLAGAAVFGLTGGESFELFRGGNNIAQIKNIARKIAASRGEYTII